MPKKAAADLKQIETYCEMERLGVGICKKRLDEDEQFALDAALRAIPFDWSLSSLTSVHDTYGYVCVLDMARPQNRLFGDRQFAMAVGGAQTAAGAVFAAIANVGKEEALIEAAPIDTEPY
jgi:hypothetical protein